MRILARICVVTAVLVFTNVGVAQKKFSDLVGPVSVKPVQQSAALQVPFITWGGDVATFFANGGLETANGSIYAQQGLKLKLVPGDDFVGQVKDYMSGKSPMLRGTLRMIGQASEVLGKSPETKPVIVLQLSWSAGDHIVARNNLTTLNDLRGQGKKVRIACQQGGPHVGLLYDSLKVAGIKRDEVEIVWADDLTGPKGPAQLFQNDANIDACCVITPDMIGLTGGLEDTGSGAEGTVKGAHVLNSTAQMSRSIADVYAVRKDWFDKNRQTVEKFVAGYLKGTQQTVEMRKQFDDSGTMSGEYRELLTSAQKIFGEEVLPTLEIDAHGLLLDCGFVGLPGQIAFFEDRSNVSGFEPKMKDALDLAVSWGYASNRYGFASAGWDYQKLAKIAGLKYERPDLSKERFAGSDAEAIDLFPDSDELDDRTIVSFTISFEPNQSKFSADRYRSEFDRAIEAASTFGNAVVAIRGHSDPTKTLVDFIKAGTELKIIKKTGQKGNYRYFMEGKEIDLTSIEQVTELIKEGRFQGTANNPAQTMQAALNLSLARSKAVKDSLVGYAREQGVGLDASQMQPVGAGILEPIVPKPKNMQQARVNMRVEFRVVRVPAEALLESDFDF
jgi:ABC-type nitrate/sulfonate/bicarbonate transport system substrate-binding protein/outer membrane protein OmpA-like peptidoglycan-associated protein